MKDTEGESVSNREMATYTQYLLDGHTLMNILVAINGFNKFKNKNMLSWVDEVVRKTWEELENRKYGMDLMKAYYMNAHISHTWKRTHIK